MGLKIAHSLVGKDYPNLDIDVLNLLHLDGFALAPPTPFWAKYIISFIYIYVNDICLFIRPGRDEGQVNKSYRIEYN